MAFLIPWEVTGAAFFDAAARAFFLRTADNVVLGMRVGPCNAAVPEDSEVQRVLRVRCKLDLEGQLLASPFSSVPVVYRSNDEAAIPFLVPPELESPDTSEDADVAGEEELRIAVCFIAFQFAPRMWSVWHSRGESLESLVGRIAIVCGLASTRIRIVACDLQPQSGFLTIVSFPSWWEDVPISPVLMISGDGLSPFVQVADRERRAVDLVPDAFFVGGRRLDAYATFDDPPLGGIAEAAPEPGACVCFQAEGLPRPVHPDTDRFLRTVEHVPAEAMPGDAYQPEPALILVLGIMMEQTLVDVVHDRGEQDVAAAMRMDEADIVLHEQLRLFERVAIRSRFPARVISVKSARVFGRRPPGFGIGRCASLLSCVLLPSSLRL